jgi:hypothetical protein
LASGVNTVPEKIDEALDVVLAAGVQLLNVTVFVE